MGDQTGGELPVEGFRNLLRAGVGFSSKMIEMYGGGGRLSSYWPACAGETTSRGADLWCGRISPEGYSTGIALLGECASGCPSPTA